MARADETAVQTNHYYPNGLTFGEGVDTSNQPYLFNGKEFDRDRSLNLYDYGARFMAPELGRFTTIDPLSEIDPSVSPYAYCRNNPLKFIDPDGRDYFQSASGALIWQNDYGKTVTINDEVYNNIGATASIQMTDGSYINYYQNVAVSNTDGLINVEQSVLNEAGLVGSLLGSGSPLTFEAQGKLMVDEIRNAQGNFISTAANAGGTALETVGNGLSVAGYAVSATGVGAGVGGAMSGVGSALSGIGAGLQLATNVSNQNYGQAAIGIVGAASSFGVTKLAAFGAAGSEQINAGVNLFFTPVNTMISNTQYNKRK